MKKQSGFTLIELAIVLVIIGLLLGGVLKGQELINSAKVKNLVSDFKNVQVYVYAYQDRFRAIPGDDRTARFTGMTTATGAADGVIQGDWLAPAATDESRLFWQHVRLAGFAPGTTVTTDGDFLPRNAEGGTIGIQGVTVAGKPILPTPLNGAFAVCSASIRGSFAKQIDVTLDDGDTATGSVRAFAAAATSWDDDIATAEDSNLYTVCTAF